MALGLPGGLPQARIPRSTWEVGAPWIEEEVLVGSAVQVTIGHSLTADSSPRMSCWR